MHDDFWIVDVLGDLHDIALANSYPQVAEMLAAARVAAEKEIAERSYLPMESRIWAVSHRFCHPVE